MFRSFLAGALAFATTAAFAQFAIETNPDWKEAEAPPPPALRTTGLIPVEMPGSSLSFGVDPDSVTVAEDRIVRYVVVATSRSGAVNAFYEGVRCNTAEMKVYASHSPDRGWVPNREAAWQPLHSRPNSRHSLVIARTGACSGDAPNRDARTIVRDLRAPVDTRFRHGS